MPIICGKYGVYTGPIEGFTEFMAKRGYPPAQREMHRREVAALKDTLNGLAGKIEDAKARHVANLGNPYSGFMKLDP